MRGSTSTTGSGVLRHRDLRLLVAGAGVSALGNAITPVALAFAVLDLGGSAAELGLVVAVFATCEVLTTLFGGVVGDRVRRQVVMEGAAVATALTQVVLAGLLVTGAATIVVVTALGALSGVVEALNQPSSRAMTRLVVPEAELPRAVAVRSVVQTSAMSVGFAGGGVLVAATGPGWAVGVSAAVFALAAACFALMRVSQETIERGTSMLADVVDGFREVVRHGWLWSQILMATLYHLFYGGAQSVLGPIVVGDLFGRAGWGWSLSFLMVGFVLGNLLCLRWRPRRSLFAGVCALVLTGLFPLAMALAGSLPLVLAGALLHGLGLQVYSVFWETALNLHVEPDRLARVYSIDIAGSFVAQPVGLALTGVVAAAVGYTTWLLVVATVISGAAVLSLAARGVRTLETP